GHDLLFVAVGIVLPSERNAIVLEGDKTMVGDGDAVGIAGQIVENVFCPAEGWLGVDDPVLPEQLPEETGKTAGSGQILLRTMKLKLVLSEELLESRDELAAE